MAKSGDVIEHPVTGERFVFLRTARETHGELLEMEGFVRPHGFVAAEHIHPMQSEHFEILAGKGKFRINGVTREALPGDHITVAAGAPHIWWNAGDDILHVRAEFRPALRTEEFFETFFGLAQAGKVNRKTGLPSLLVMALVLREFDQEVCLAQPPLAVQRVLFGMLRSMGRLRGYQGVYAYPR